MGREIGEKKYGKGDSVFKKKKKKKGREIGEKAEISAPERKNNVGGDEMGAVV